MQPLGIRFHDATLCCSEQAQQARHVRQQELGVLAAQTLEASGNTCCWPALAREPLPM